MRKNIKKNIEKNIEKNKEIAICRTCGFSAQPDRFNPAYSPYHDLRCPDCGTTDIDWTFGSYKDNVLVLLKT